jgi:CBS domain containing-hemolysin-like protein
VIILPKIKKSKSKKSKIRNWVIIITLWTFILAITLSFISETIINKANLIIDLVVLILIVFIGILFDIIGVAVTASSEIPLNSMAANKIKGAREAVNLLKNADKVANFCNDAIGDITGIISGAVSAAIILRLLLINPNIEKSVLGAVITGFIASLTVGGKALGKSFALKNCTMIVLKTGYFIYIISFIFKRKKR